MAGRGGAAARIGLGASRGRLGSRAGPRGRAVRPDVPETPHSRSVRGPERGTAGQCLRLWQSPVRRPFSPATWGVRPPQGRGPALGECTVRATDSAPAPELSPIRTRDRRSSRSRALLPKRLQDISALSQASSGRLGHRGRFTVPSPGLSQRTSTALHPWGPRLPRAQDSSRAPRFPHDEVQTLHQGSRARPNPAFLQDQATHLFLPVSLYRGTRSASNVLSPLGLVCAVPSAPLPGTWHFPCAFQAASSSGQLPTPTGWARCRRSRPYTGRPGGL